MKQIGAPQPSRGSILEAPERDRSTSQSSRCHRRLRFTEHLKAQIQSTNPKPLRSPYLDQSFRNLCSHHGSRSPNIHRQVPSRCLLQHSASRRRSNLLLQSSSQGSRCLGDLSQPPSHSRHTRCRHRCRLRLYQVSLPPPLLRYSVKSNQSIHPLSHSSAKISEILK